MKHNFKKTLTLAAATAALGTSLGVIAVDAADKITVQEGTKTIVQESSPVKVESVQGKVESVQGKVESVQGKIEGQDVKVSNQIKWDVTK